MNKFPTSSYQKTKRYSHQLAQDAQARLSFSDTISEVLATSLDAETIFNSLAQLAVPKFADWCVVFTVEPDGRIRRLKTGYADPKKKALARAFEKHLASPEVVKKVSTGLQDFLRKARPKLTRVIDDDWIVSSSRDKEDLRLMQKLDPKSHIAVPLIAGKKMLGFVSFFRIGKSPSFSIEDLALAKELARRTSIAITNARLYKDLELEISERKRAESRLRTQYELTRMLSESKTLDSALPAIIKSICQELEWDFGAAWLIDNSSNTLRIAYHWQSKNIPSKKFTSQMKAVSLNMGEGLAGRCWEKATEMWTPDVSQEKNALIRSITSPVGLHADAAFPIVIGKNVLGVIEFFHKERKKPDVHFFSMMNGMGLQIGQFIERIELEQRKDDYISIASHELKTPITSIKAFIQVLMAKGNKSADKSTLGMLTKVNSQVDRLTLLVQDLLDVSKIQAGRLSLRLEEFEIDDLIHQVVTDLQQFHTSHEIQIKGSTCTSIKADKERIIQALTNLLENAVKYSPKAKKVIVTVICDSASVKIGIKDFGIGIEKNDQEKIFDRFYRVTDSTYAAQGQGLGLYITSEIVKRHGGTISVESKKGKGSLFTVSLPLVP